MPKKCFEFEVETSWTIYSKYVSLVEVFDDRVEISRKGRMDSIPEHVTIYYSNISSISYTKDRNYMLSYISFAGMSGSLSQSISGVNFGKVMAASSSANPWHDPYGIVFKMDLYEACKPYYQEMVEVFEKYKRDEPNSSVSSVVLGESSLDKLKKLKELKECGIISDEEYEEKRVKLLAEV